MAAESIVSAAFLQQAHRNNWQKYLASLKADARGGWDLCVLTASNEGQATMIRRQLTLRCEAGLLSPRTRFLVIADPADQRIGSGGATLRVLTMLAEGEGRLGTDQAFAVAGDARPIQSDVLTNGRVLIIHSGGDSRRLPHCSAIGKLFARIPRTLPDGRASTLFDEFLISLSGLAVELSAGTLVASGDVLLIFDHLQLSFQRQGVIGVAAAAPVEMGMRHGVYVTREGYELRAYLHKPSIAQLQHWDAIRDDGTVAIDTGLAWLDAQAAHKFVALARSNAMKEIYGWPTADGEPPTNPDQPLPVLNLYGDLLLPLAESTTLESYLADTSDGPATPARQAARRAIWEHVRGLPFTVERLQPTIFVHFGTSYEYWTLVAASPDLARTCGWTGRTASWVSQPTEPESDKLVLVNAIVGDNVAVESGPGLIVDAHLAGPLTLHGASLVAGLDTRQPLTLRADVVLHQVPVRDGFVTRVFGLTDDPKRPWRDPAATFMNQPWLAWLAQAGVDPETVWSGIPVAARTLWNARLYPVAVDREQSLALSLPLQDVATAPSGWKARWQSCLRLSMAESFAQADSERILAELAAIEDEVAVRRFYSAVEAERPAAEAKLLLGTVPGAVTRRAQRVGDRLAFDNPILRLRGYKALEEATCETTWKDQAFATLAAMIQVDLPPGSSPVRRREQATRVQAAARIDFGGGWTDTPPHSIERGGAVLNAAVTLHGQYPVVAEAEWLPQPKLVLESLDVGMRIEPTYAGEVLAYANLADPLALLKAALVLRGFVPAGMPAGELLTRRLGELGGGLRLSTQTIVPRGSGLGISSIMAGAVLACLAELLGLEVTMDRLFDEVLCLEQMLTTGGGWQDQVGGLVGGIKLVTTPPGLPQQIQIEPVRWPPGTQAELADRLLLVYTGQQRLAKNLLRPVMGRWMARDPEMVWILGEIARLAVAMQAALQAGDVSGFGALLGEHWALNKRMDPGCTNPFIDGLFEVMGPYTNGGKLAGAGGGGFSMLVARDKQAATELAAALQRVYPGTPVAVWPCTVPEEGMVVGE